jgi:uncharacterized protein
MLSNQSQEKIRTYFSQKPVLNAYLFGSFARNEENDNSDIDLLVDLDYKNGADYFLFFDMREQLSELLNKKVYLVSSNGLSKFIKPIIEAEKKLIYSKNNV